MIAAICIITLSAFCLLVAILTARDEYEDAAGFHYGRPPSVMRVDGDYAYICAWCDTDSSGTRWAKDHALMTSHGICPTCRAAHFHDT